MSTAQEVVSFPPAEAPARALVVRNVAVDAYRGFVMLLMMAEVLRLYRVSQAYPGNWFWHILAYNQTHVEWAGCSLHDLIQPSFSFLVGVALPYSIASRIAKGGTFWKLFAHALWRSFALAALGIFLRSMGHAQTNFTMEDTLTQIGFGYPFLFLLGFRPPRWAWAALGVILSGYWLAWALYPVAGPHFDWQSVGVSAAWNAQHNYTGFAAHWNKNYNLGIAFDRWFLNLFPRATPWVFNEGGYLTLSFIPTLGTMILGLIAGRWLRAAAPQIPLKKFLVAGVVGTCHRPLFPLHAHLSRGETHLDAQLDAVQWRCVLPAAGGVLLGHRDEAAPRLGVSPGGHRHEFHRRLLHRSLHGRFPHRHVSYQPRPALLRVPRNRPPASPGRRRCAVLLLVGVVLDVP